MSSLQVNLSSCWLCVNPNQWICSNRYNWSHIHVTANLQPLYCAIVVYASRYMWVWVDELVWVCVCTFLMSWQYCQWILPKYYNINTYKIEDCYTLLLPVGATDNSSTAWCLQDFLFHCWQWYEMVRCKECRQMLMKLLTWQRHGSLLPNWNEEMKSAKSQHSRWISIEFIDCYRVNWGCYGLPWIQMWHVFI